MFWDALLDDGYSLKTAISHADKLIVVASGVVTTEVGCGWLILTVVGCG